VAALSTRVVKRKLDPERLYRIGIDEVSYRKVTSTWRSGDR